MFSIDVVRMHHSQRDAVDEINPLDYEVTNTLLETPITSWQGLVPDLRRVPRDVHPKDYSVYTILGQNDQFMEPFRAGRYLYDTAYEEGSWCKFESQLEESQQLLESSSPFLESNSDPSFAQKLITEPNSRVIFIGDIHSSFHSFVEIVDNLVSRGILRDDLSLKPEYYIIFLGDIFDRGPYALDILNILFQIKNKSFDRIVVLNGNHEDMSMYSSCGTGEEIHTQLDDHHKMEEIHDLVKRLPSVLFLYTNGKILQCCHGGIEPNYRPKLFLDSEFQYDFHGYDPPFGRNRDTTCDLDDEDYANLRLGDVDLVHRGLRWTDFNPMQEGKALNPRRGMVYGTRETRKYLDDNGIEGIIRGHQDFHHITLLPRKMGNIRDDNSFDVPGIYVGDNLVRDGTLYAPTSNYPSSEDSPEYFKFHRVPIENIFQRFSVVTTSTAVRARPNVQYFTYLELKTKEQSFIDAQHRLMKLMDTALPEEISELISDTELQYLLSCGSESTMNTRNIGKITSVFETIKNNFNRYYILLPLYELLSWKPFVSPFVLSMRAWRG